MKSLKWKVPVRKQNNSEHNRIGQGICPEIGG